MPPAAIAAAAVGGAVIGGVAGSQKDVVETERRRLLGAPSDLEKLGLQVQQEELGTLRDFVSQGPSGDDLQASLTAQRGLAARFGELSETGLLPTSQDITRTSGIAQQIFAPEQTALEQFFRRQETEAQRTSARLGRPVNDPILQSKLRTGFLEQQALLGARTGSFAAQLALQQPQQRLSLQQAQASVLGGLASQALQNRQTLLGLGQQIANSERNFRLQSAPEIGRQTSGGGLKGGLLGGLSGAATLGGAAAGFGGGGGGLPLPGFGGGQQSPVATPPIAPLPSPNLPLSQQVGLFQPNLGVTFGQSSPFLR